MTYIRDVDKLESGDLKEFTIDRQTKEIIQPGDELFIRVTSSNERPTNFSTRYETFGIDVTLRSYTVSEEGYIRFPYIGKVYVQNKSLEETSEEIEMALNDYLYTPSVFVKFVNKKITIIGSVTNPGVYNFYDKKINLFQAVAHAGDVTTFGNRKHVVLLREEGDKVTKYIVDMTDEGILTSEIYVIQPDDIIYVEPLRMQRWGFESFPYTLLITMINTALLMWAFIISPY
ncbi:polysaccharide biosynthesis/export family protein [Bacteroidota bacterium]